MKKTLAFIILCAILSMTGCNSGNHETETTEKIEDTTTNKIEVTTSKSANETTEEVDANNLLHDEDLIFEQFYDVYKSKVDLGSLQIPERVKEHIIYQYDDFNEDGQEDVLCYSETPSSTFEEVVLFTLIGDQVTIVSSDFVPVFAYGQTFVKERNFIVHAYTGGGTGLQVSSISLYYVLNGKIVDTGGMLTLEGKLGIPPTESNPDGITMTYLGEIDDLSYEIGNADDRWLMFRYHYSEINDDTQSIEYEKTELYKLDTKTGKYQVELLDEKIAKPSSETASKTGEVYLLDSLKSGQTLEQFIIEDAYYNSENKVGFTLSGEAKLQGQIIWDEASASFIFKSDVALLSAPIRIMIHGLPNDYDRPSYAQFDNSILEQLTDAQYKQLETKLTANVEITIGSYSVNYNSDSEVAQDIAIETLEWKETGE